jgi:SulP family sulfate permease
VPRRSLKRLYQDEFTGYSIADLRRDSLAGLTVAAVALPLALAFGVASGASAAAGLVTAVVAGLLIGALSGAPYQISGPTGAMSAVLIVLVQRYGLEGIWMAGLLSGVFLLVVGLLRLGRFVSFVPAPVVTGFTSGIAIVIFVSQVDNFLGVTTPQTESTLAKLLGYAGAPFVPNPFAVAIGLGAIAVMVFTPSRLSSRVPASLLAIVAATAVAWLLSWPVDRIGEIPRSLILDTRFDPRAADWWNLPDLLAPALAITALGAVESLLCGTVASRMTGIRLQANQELIAQGIGNIAIPFFGGVPATAAIARSGVGIKAGGRTRVVSIVHALGLLGSMLLFAGVMARIPLAALAGVLMVTAWRMNEWHSIRFIFSKRFKAPILAFVVTLIATITLDLTQAILLGSAIAAAVFLTQIATIEVDVQEVDPARLEARGIHVDGNCRHVKVAFVTGPLFFAATGYFDEAFANLEDTHTLILSVRGVPFLDTAGLEAIIALRERLAAVGGTLMFAGVHDTVMRYLERADIVALIGPDNFFWSSDEAIVEAERRGCPRCELPG